MNDNCLFYYQFLLVKLNLKRFSIFYSLHIVHLLWCCSSLNINFVNVFEGVVSVVDWSWSNNDWSWLNWGNWGFLGIFFQSSDLDEATSVGFDVVHVEGNEGSESDSEDNSAMSVVSSSVVTVMSVMSVVSVFTMMSVMSVMSVFSMVFSVVLWSLSVFLIILIFIIFLIFFIIIRFLVILLNLFWEVFVVSLKCDNSSCMLLRHTLEHLVVEEIFLEHLVHFHFKLILFVHLLQNSATFLAFNFVSLHDSLCLFGMMVLDDVSGVWSHDVDADNEEEYPGESLGVHSIVAFNKP